MSPGDRLRPEHRALRDVDREFSADVLAGLSQPAKAIACRWLYDARGSALFEAITALPEYYPTRTESAILAARAHEFARHALDGGVLLEFGSGSSRKTELLIRALPNLAAYVPIDVSAPALSEACGRLAEQFPRLRVCPVVGDFLAEPQLPVDLRVAPRIGFFPGSTIGNFQPADAAALLMRFGRILRRGAHLLVGVDLRKPLDRLLPAYDDAQGVTAAFNRNLLVRINCELGADFDLSGFAHEAVWNARESRVEMRLVSLRRQCAHVQGVRIDFATGERIHTENSYKYDLDDFSALAADAGWRAANVWSDDERLFSVFDLAHD